MQGSERSAPRRARRQHGAGRTSPTGRPLLFALLAAALISFNLAEVVHHSLHASHGEQQGCEWCLPFAGSAIGVGEWSVPALALDEPPPLPRPPILPAARRPAVHCRGPPSVAPLRSFRVS